MHHRKMPKGAEKNRQSRVGSQKSAVVGRFTRVGIGAEWRNQLQRFATWRRMMRVSATRSRCAGKPPPYSMRLNSLRKRLIIRFSRREI
ncbi:hypothetical protein ALPO108162_08065 [Alicyclobacillus pomorum]